MKDIVEFMWTTAKLSECFMVDASKADSGDHLELNIQSKVMQENGDYEYIPLDPQVKLIDVINYLWMPLNPEWNPARDT